MQNYIDSDRILYSVRFEIIIYSTADMFLNDATCDNLLLNGSS